MILLRRNKPTVSNTLARVITPDIRENSTNPLRELAWLFMSAPVRLKDAVAPLKGFALIIKDLYFIHFRFHL